MANTLTPIIDKLIARGLNVLRENAVMPRLVNSTYSTVARDRGDTITVPVAADITAAAVSPSNTLAAAGDTVLTSKTISLDQWQHAGFFLTDQQITQLDVDSMNTLQGDEAVRSLANNVDSYILGLYTGIYSQTGTAATTPFATTLNDWTSGARSKLNNFKALMDGRAVVLDADAEGNAIGNRGLQDASWRGTTEGIVTGDIGYALGASWHLDQNIPTHTNANGTPTGWLVNSTGSTAGDTTIAIDTGSNNPVAGDIFTVAASTQQFVVSSFAGSTITFQPALTVALANNSAITFAAAHVVNVAFQQNAFGFAMAPIMDASLNSDSMRQVTDEKTGLTMRLEVSRQEKQWKFDYDILYGATLLRPEAACRILG
tara:strand:- start:366 stop:1484 length:1119 start_codon:yes stop_codon:yes gene_type:complete